MARMHLSGPYYLKMIGGVEFESTDGRSWRPTAGLGAIAPITVTPKESRPWTSRGPQWGVAKRDGRKRNKVVHREPQELSLRKKYKLIDLGAAIRNAYPNHDRCKVLFVEAPVFTLPQVVSEALANWKPRELMMPHFRCELCDLGVEHGQT